MTHESWHLRRTGRQRHTKWAGTIGTMSPLGDSWRLLTYGKKRSPEKGASPGVPNRAGASARIVNSITGRRAYRQNLPMPLTRRKCKSRASASDQALSVSLTRSCNVRRQSAAGPAEVLGIDATKAGGLSEKPDYAPAECDQVTDPNPAVDGPPPIVGRRPPVVGALGNHQPELRADPVPPTSSRIVIICSYIQGCKARCQSGPAAPSGA
jgi:hypothetical protein